MSFIGFLKRNLLVILDDHNTRQVEVRVKFARLDKLLALNTKSWYTPFMEIRGCIDVRENFDEGADADLIFTIEVRAPSNPTACSWAETWLRAGLRPEILDHDVGDYKIIKSHVTRFYLADDIEQEDSPPLAPLPLEYVPIDAVDQLNARIADLAVEFEISISDWDAGASSIVCEPLEVEIMRDETGALWVRVTEIETEEYAQFAITSVGTRRFANVFREMAREAGAVPRE